MRSRCLLRYVGRHGAAPCLSMPNSLLVYLRRDHSHLIMEITCAIQMFSFWHKTDHPL